MKKLHELSILDVLKHYKGYHDSDFTAKGHQYITKCPIHNDTTPSFHIYEKDTGWDWNCYSCPGHITGGNVISLVIALGLAQNSTKAIELLENDFPEYAPPQEWDVNTFCEYKGLDREFVINKLRWTSESAGIKIPYFAYNADMDSYKSVTDEDENAITIKIRRHPKDVYKDLKKQKYIYVKGVSNPYGLQFLNTEDKSVLYITEGETDAVTMLQAGLTAIGMPSKNGWSAEYKAYIADFDDIILVMDNDNAGKDLLTDISRDMDNLSVLEMPHGIKDINDFHNTRCHGDIEQFKKMVKELLIIPATKKSFLNMAEKDNEKLSDERYWKYTTHTLSNEIIRAQFIEDVAKQTKVKKGTIVKMLEDVKHNTNKASLEPWYKYSEKKIDLLYGTFSDHLIEKYHIKKLGTELIKYNSKKGVYDKMDDDDIFTLVRSELIHEFSEDPLYIKKTIEQLEGDSRIKIAQTDMDADKTKINVKNGILDISDINSPVLLKHSPEYLTMLQLNVNYNKDAEVSTDFMNFINEKLPNEDTRLRAQEVLGYCLSNEYSAEKWFMLQGKGRTGKGTYQSIIREIVGSEYLSAVSLENIADRFTKVQYFGKRVNIGGDIKGTVISDDVGTFLKQLVGRDVIEAEYKGKPHFHYVNTAKMIFACNDFPQNASDMGKDSFWNKMIVVKFDVTSGDNVDVDLKDRLIYEQKNLDYIFLWALEGLKSFKARGKNGSFAESQESNQLMLDNIKKSSSVLQFIEEGNSEFAIGNSKHTYMAADDFMQLYAAWCAINSKKTLGWDKIIASLKSYYGEQFGFYKERSRITGRNIATVFGISLTHQQINTSEF